MTDHPRELLPISLVAHTVFCPRRAWLEAVGEKVESFAMAVGVRDHAATDDPSRSRGTRVVAMDVESPSLGVVGRCDVVEVDGHGHLTVVEHKSAPVRRTPEVTDAQRVQVTLQVMALREMGHEVAAGAVYFPQHRKRVPLRLTSKDERTARGWVDLTREVVESPTAPPPLEDDPRCRGCSHVSVCLPDERPLAPVRRRVLVSDPAAQVLHLTTPGSSARVRTGRLLVQHRGEQTGSVPLERVQAVVVHGNVDLSGGLLRELLWRDVPIVWCSSSGRVVGWARAAASANGLARVRQHVASERGRLDLARQFVSGKVTNQGTLLRRLGDAAPSVSRLRELARRAERASSVPELFGIEGDAAARYFDGFASMLKPNVTFAPGEEFRVRERRPARDPVNASLNYCYGLLVADATRAVLACGLDPHAGFLHSSARNKPALALDLCEEFRSPVADSAVIGAFNNGEIRASDFTSVTGACRLRPTGRTALVTAYERRITTEFTHPTFGYRVTWRRALEVQARMLLGCLDGTQQRYASIRTR